MTDLRLALNILGVTSEGEVAWCWGAEALDSSNVIYANESELTSLLATLHAPGPVLYPYRVCRMCETAAVVVIGADSYCNGHAGAAA